MIWIGPRPGADIVLTESGQRIDIHIGGENLTVEMVTISAEQNFISGGIGVS